jgi:hypothetical protein
MSPEPHEGWFPTFRAMPRNLLLLPWHILRGIIWLGRKTWRFSLSILILLVIAHTIFNFIAGRKLEAELSHLRQTGEPLTWVEAAPPPVPDSENAAVLYEKAFKLFGSDEMGETQNPDVQTVKSFMDWQYHQNTTRPTLAQVAAAVAHLQSVFPLLEEASLRPACRFPVDWAAGFEARFPHLAQIRLATRLLTAKALVDSSAGNSAQTVTDIATIIRMANQIAPEPILISQLVRIACLSVIFQYFPTVLENASFDSTQSRALYDALASAKDRTPYVHAMEGERCSGIFAFGFIRRKNPIELISPSSDDGNPGTRAFIRCWPVIRVIWEPLLKLDEVHYLKFMQREITIAAQPYRKAYKQYKILDDDRPWYALVSVIIPPVFSQPHAKEDQLIAEAAVMQGALALRAYQIEHGQYPDSLAQLRAGGGWEIESDPFSGKDLIFRRQGNGYILYSVGPNFKDDGGLNFQEARQKKPPQANYDFAIKMTQ